MPLDLGLISPILEQLDCAALVLDQRRRVLLFNPPLAELWPVAGDLLGQRPPLARWLAAVCDTGCLGDDPAETWLARWEARLAGGDPTPVVMPAPGGTLSGRSAALPGGAALLTLRRDAAPSRPGYFQEIVESLQEAVCVCSADHRIEYANPAMRSWVAGEPRHRLCHEAIYGRDEVCPGCARERVLSRQEPFCTVFAERQDGRRFAVTHSPLETPEGSTSCLTVYRDVTGEDQLQSALQEARGFAESLVRDSAVATFVIDGDHRVTLWNQACAELTGVAAREMLGTREHWRAFYPEPQRCLADYVLDGQTPQPQAGYEQCSPSTLTPGALRAERWLQTPGDGPRYLSFEAAPIRDRAGAIVAVIETLHDLTASRRATEALAESENRYRTLFEGAADGILILETSHADPGRIVTGNAAAAEMHGYPLEDLTGRNLREILAPEPTGTVERALERILAGEVVLVETEHLRSDGSRFPAEVRAAPMEMAGGRYSLALVRDISERRQAEEQTLLLTSAVAQVEEGVAVVDRTGRVAYANRAFAAAAGTDPALLPGRPMPLPGDATTAQALLLALQNHAPWRRRVETRAADGSSAAEDWSVTPVTSPSRELNHLIVMRRDVSRELELERSLSRAQQLEAVGTLASGIAHDFNNLLSGIIGHAEVTLDDVPPGSHGAANLGRIIRAGERGRDLVHQLLAFSRHSEEALTPVSLSASIEEAVGLLRAALPPSVELRLCLDAEHDTIRGDPTRLQQALMNLCTNAAQAMGEAGGVVELGLEPVLVDEDLAARYPDLSPGEHLRVTVSDTGHGIPADVLRHIFEPFFTTKQVGEGTGLGLSATHGIVRAHGGAIRVFSTPGEGTTFHLFFPRDQAAPCPSSPAPRLEGGGRVLFVDDEPDVVELASRILERLGYQVTTATSGVGALEMLRADPGAFDVLVSDHSMAPLTGLELAEASLALRPELPVVLCSGYSQARIRERAQDLGVARFLLKPITVVELGAAVRGALDDGRAARGAG